MKTYIMLGKFPYDFVDQETGRRVSGVTCFVAEEQNDPKRNGQGYYPKRFSFKPDSVTYEPGIMESCGIVFNEYGKIDDFTPC